MNTDEKDSRIMFDLLKNSSSKIMNNSYIEDLNNWIHYVNNWLHFWNVFDLACFGIILCWLTYLTIRKERFMK